MPYTSPHSTAVSRLLLARGDAAANTAQAKGEAWSRGLTGVGAAVGQGLNRYAQWTADAPERQLRELQVKDATRKGEIQQHINDAWTLAGGDADLAVETLKKGGHGAAADALSRQVTDTRIGELDLQTKKYGQARQQLEQARSFLPEKPANLEDEAAVTAFRSSYASAMPQIAKLVGQDLATKLPAADDPDLLNKVDQLREIGMTVSEKLQLRQNAMQQARAAIEQNQDHRATVKDASDWLTSWLPLTESQQEWDDAFQSVTAFGVKGDDLTSLKKAFGDTWSPESVEKAGLAALSPQQRVEMNEPVRGANDTYNHYKLLERAKRAELGRPLNPAERSALWAQSSTNARSLASGRMDQKERSAYVTMVLAQPEVWNDLTQTVKSELAADLFAQGFEFPSGNTSEVERWKFGRIDALKARKANNNNTVSDEDFFAQWREIEDLARVQLGKPPLTDDEFRMISKQPGPPRPEGDITLPPDRAKKTAPRGTPSAHKVGDVVTVRGQQIKITRVYADGSFDGDNVAEAVR